MRNEIDWNEGEANFFFIFVGFMRDNDEKTKKI